MIRRLILTVRCYVHSTEGESKQKIKGNRYAHSHLVATGQPRSLFIVVCACGSRGKAFCAVRHTCASFPLPPPVLAAFLPRIHFSYCGQRLPLPQFLNVAQPQPVLLWR